MVILAPNLLALYPNGSVSDQYLTVYSPSRSALYLQRVWHSRETLKVLFWRDINVRYKQAAIGILWAILKPLISFGTLLLAFHIVAKTPNAGLSPVSVVLTGLVPWIFFATALSEVGNCFIDNRQLISKAYFPRLILPLATFGTALLELMISLVLVLLVVGYIQGFSEFNFIYFILSLVFLFVVAFGFSVGIAVLNVKYRDFRYISGFITQFGLYISPVGYLSSLVPESWGPYYFINPMSGAIDLFRYSILGEAVDVSWFGVGLSFLIAIIISIIAYNHLKSFERTMADII